MQNVKIILSVVVKSRSGAWGVSGCQRAQQRCSSGHCVTSIPGSLSLFLKTRLTVYIQFNSDLSHLLHGLTVEYGGTLCLASASPFAQPSLLTPLARRRALTNLRHAPGGTLSPTAIRTGMDDDIVRIGGAAPDISRGPRSVPSRGAQPGAPSVRVDPRDNGGRFDFDGPGGDAEGV